LRVRWIVAALVVVFIAYVSGRAAGILLGVSPYVTEIVAMVVVVAAGWAAGRRRA
jgi:hypothetical protein